MRCEIVLAYHSLAKPLNSQSSLIAVRLLITPTTASRHPKTCSADRDTLMNRIAADEEALSGLIDAWLECHASSAAIRPRVHSQVIRIRPEIRLLIESAHRLT